MKERVRLLRRPGPARVLPRAAAAVPTTFVSTYETQTTAFATEIANVEAGGKDPEQAWDDAVDQTDKILAKRGVI